MSVSNSRPSLDGSVIVITGGARGIGAELVTQLASSNASVVIADILKEEGATLQTQLIESGRECLFHYTDVADVESTRSMAAAVLHRYGRIDALVNNAAIYQSLGSKKHFTEITVDEWDRVLAVNAKGVWLTTAAVYPAMKAQGRGKVVNIASATVRSGVPFFAHYTASKGAVIALTRSLAREVGADGITVNAIAPGLVDTDSSAALNDRSYFPTLADQRAIPRAMTASDLHGAVSFFCSAASDFITGQTVVIDGGLVFT